MAPFDTFSRWIVSPTKFPLFTSRCSVQLICLLNTFNGFLVGKLTKIANKCENCTEFTTMTEHETTGKKNVWCLWKTVSHIHTLFTANCRIKSIFRWFVYGFQYKHIRMLSCSHWKVFISASPVCISIWAKCDF